mmetsp:Transcript_24059/g.44300  ORF Transcript_24059/g.44300 Transcript_24059/m.44300 type:complete len:238 (-) Transcript_24059:5924-6637(-)
MAPVRVARSIMPAGAKRSCAYHITSHRTKRPSASVLMISTVSPFIEATTSPGRVAFPEGMFSTKPTRPTTLALALRSASARIVPATTPAPPMSMVMSSMPPAGFRLMPPVSKTTPLPTSANGASPSVPPFHCITTTLDGLSDPCPTLSKVRMPKSSNAVSSSTSTVRPKAAISASRLANSVVVNTFAGSLTRSRVINVPSATASNGAAASVASSGRLHMISTSPSGPLPSVLCGVNA